MVRLKNVLLISFLMSLWLHSSLNNSSSNRIPFLFDNIVKVQSPPSRPSSPKPKPPPTSPMPAPHPGPGPKPPR